MTQPPGSTNHPVAVSRNGLGVTVCSRPPGQVRVTSEATSTITSVTAGLARSKASCGDSAAVAGETIPASSTSVAVTHRRISDILRDSLMTRFGWVRPQKREAPGGDPWSLVRPSRVAYFRIEMAASAFSLAPLTSPALHAASASLIRPDALLMSPLGLAAEPARAV